MARNDRPAGERRLARRIAGAGVVVIVAGALLLSLPAIAPDTPLPVPVAKAAEDSVRLDKPSVPVRVRVPYAGIDLPVVSSERRVAGNPGNYPLCDVAQYWTRYDLPGAPGTTWIYAHAQPGMFLPLFDISEQTDGRGLLRKIVEVQTKDGRLLRYRINEVKERARNRKIAQRDGKREHRLILQTSTGPPGTIPKLQVAARLVDAKQATEPAPKPRPRACWQPRPKPTPRNRVKTPSPSPTPVAVPGEDVVDPVALVMGGGAILLGATFVAIYLVRRQP